MIECFVDRHPQGPPYHDRKDEGRRRGCLESDRHPSEAHEGRARLPLLQPARCLLCVARWVLT